MGWEAAVNNQFIVASGQNLPHEGKKERGREGDKVRESAGYTHNLVFPP